jgi:hypothetical protein
MRLTDAGIPISPKINELQAERHSCVDRPGGALSAGRVATKVSPPRRSIHNHLKMTEYYRRFSPAVHEFLFKHNTPMIITYEGEYIGARPYRELCNAPNSSVYSPTARFLVSAIP